LGQLKQRAWYFGAQFLAFKSAAATTASAAASTTATSATATASARATAITATSAATALALGHHVDAGACGIWLALAATLGFVAKGVDATLGA
jgi:exo-beta-1,3-glucanase (GH17 family)